MNLKPLASNMTELNIGTKSILYSYSTPVAYFDFSLGAGNGVYVQTNKYWSKTTTKHINKWLNGNIAGKVDQYVLDNLLNEVK